MPPFFFLLHVTFIAVPLMSTTLLIVNPCSPPFLISMTSFCQGVEHSHPTLTLWIPALVFETWSFLVIFNTGTFYPAYVFFMGVICLSNYLRLLALWDIFRIILNDELVVCYIYERSYCDIIALGLLKFNKIRVSFSYNYRDIYREQD